MRVPVYGARTTGRSSSILSREASTMNIQHILLGTVCILLILALYRTSTRTVQARQLESFMRETALLVPTVWSLLTILFRSKLACPDKRAALLAEVSIAKSTLHMIRLLDLVNDSDVPDKHGSTIMECAAIIKKTMPDPFTWASSGLITEEQAREICNTVARLSSTPGHVVEAKEE